MKSSFSTEAMEATDLMQELSRTSTMMQDARRRGRLHAVSIADARHAITANTARRDTGGDLPTLTKAELAGLLFEQLGLNKREAKEMVDALFDEIACALERGEFVKLAGFGNFQLRDKAARPGRNPKTGAAVNIAARRVVTFRPSRKLKEDTE